MFNSQKINTDPQPYVIAVGIGAGMRVDEGATLGWHDQYDYVPRPEYDNNLNPILLEFRSALEHGVSDASLRALFNQIDMHLAEWRRMGADEAQLDHARKVLTRLVNIFGTEN